MSADTTANGPTPVLELKGLCKSFGGLHAVRGVTFKIMPGDRKAIIGPNGAGKTTLFNLITGIFAASAGQVVLLAKWAFRKTCQVLINETLARQRVFNGHVRDSYAQLSAELMRLRERVEALEPGEAPSEPSPRRRSRDSTGRGR